MTPQQSRESDSHVDLHVSYRLRLPVSKAEEIVGRPWVTLDESDDSWLCDLEVSAQDHLPDLIGDYITGEPDVEAD
jgi:hypothetical protein